MSWRTVVISRRAKLDLKMSYLVVRGTETALVHLSEISILIIESTAVSLTASLLCELSKRKIKVIFCDEKRNPSSELVSYYGSHDTSGKIREQIKWSKNLKNIIWTEIVTEKIRKQRDLLNALGKTKEAGLLSQYILEIMPGDTTNREAHAAKVYFNAIFGMDFSRATETPVNTALNYGYGVILSAFNREIVSCGYITQLGLFHNNQFNEFNLGSDLMEPFRILVDAKVVHMKPESIEHEEKMEIVNLLNERVSIDRKSQTISNAVKIYSKSIFEALSSNDISKIRFYTNEF